MPKPTLSEANISDAYHPNVVAGRGGETYSFAGQGDHAQEFITAV